MNRTTVLLGLLTLALLATPALATLPDGVSGTVHSRATVGEKVKVREVEGTEFVTQQITIQPGGNTGWHSHPGAALASVKTGTIELTSVHGTPRSPRCTTTLVSGGQSFVDPGHGNVHIARNVGTTPAELWVTYTGVPVGGAFRLDAADPGC